MLCRERQYSSLIYPGKVECIAIHFFLQIPLLLFLNSTLKNRYIGGLGSFNFLSNLWGTFKSVSSITSTLSIVLAGIYYKFFKPQHHCRKRVNGIQAASQFKIKYTSFLVFSPIRKTVRCEHIG